MKTRNKLTLQVPKNKEFFKHRKKYKGVFMNQANGVIEVFKEFFEEQIFDVIIELGTDKGGFTLFLVEQCGNKVHTFDIENKLGNIEKKLRSLGAFIHTQNIFKTKDVKNLIESEGRVLVLCDNGNKPKELELFSKYLKNNDVIMVHDYLKDAKTYRSQNIWRTCAFMDEYAEKYTTLKPYYQELFADAYWMCRIKGV